MIKQHKALTVSGWIITVLVSAMLTMSASMKFIRPEGFVEGFVGKFGIPEYAASYIGMVEIACLLIYLFPRTAVLGAVLLTGYLGGATMTHVRVEDNFVAPIIIGVFVWLGIFLREPRLRALLPWRIDPPVAATK